MYPDENSEWALPPIHRNTDPQTSTDSAVEITTSGKRASLMKRCLWYVQDNPCQTAGEISKALGLNSWQVSKRLSDLKNQGLIMQEGQREFEGHQQVMWRPVEYEPMKPKRLF